MQYLKNTLLILIGSFFVCSCSDEDFAEPIYRSIEIGSMQASLNGDLFASDNVHTVRQANSLIKITASSSTYGLTIALSSRTTGVYSIGSQEANYLSYTSVIYDDLGSVEKTYTSQDEYNATGTIEILETDLENNTLSGVFNGTIILDEEANISLDIKNGIFNQVPF